VFSLLEYSTEDLDAIANSTGQVIINPLIQKVSIKEVSESNVCIQILSFQNIKKNNKPFLSFG